MNKKMLVGLLVGTGMLGVAQAAPEGVRIKNKSNIEFVVVGNNADVLAQHDAKRVDARKYVEKLKQAITEILEMKKLPEGPALPAQHKKIVALMKEGEVFGPFLGPLDKCRRAGIDTNSFWAVMSGGNDSSTPDEALTKVSERIHECEVEIKSPPTSKVSLAGPVDQTKPPFKGCLRVLELGDELDYIEWTCPAASIDS
ncbi:hypothetical protein J4P02_22845 [Pseudomonas sp. NFXW11]|uniref:hypothetical protein n=1 Tax=Pseudomonas sp. NFXW11 TaxID=2819531 RepID=UPI003CED5F1E